MRKCPACMNLMDDREFVRTKRGALVGFCSDCRSNIGKQRAGKRSYVYLGVNIGETLVSMCFDVTRMRYGHPGYDFILNSDNSKIDVKSAILSVHGFFKFQIKRNPLPDWFYCIGFDDCINMNPLKMYIFPASFVNKQADICVYNPFASNRWHKTYEHPIDALVAARRKL